jgi:hypothetical protein
MPVYCEHGNESLGSTKDGLFLDLLRLLASQEGFYSLDFVSLLIC